MSWTSMVACQTCGGNDWAVVDGSWTCSCGRRMHVLEMGERPGDKRA